MTPRASSHPGEQIDIAITGRGVVSSIGEGADAFFDALIAASGSKSAHGARPSTTPERRSSNASTNASAPSPIDETTPRPVIAISMWGDA